MPREVSLPSLRAWGCPILFAIASFWLWSNRHTYGGDPEIHLVFAQHLLDGYPLQFNKGIFSSGESSPGYMCLLAAGMLLMGPANAAIFSKVFGVASALGLLAVLYRECRSVGLRRYPSLTLVSVLAAAPFFFFQAQLGMENMPFALMVAAMVRASLLPSMTLRMRLLLFAGAHALFFWRPEAILLVVYLYTTWFLRSPRSFREVTASGLMSVALLLTVLWIERRTGVPLQGAGEARALTSRFESYQLGFLPVYVSTKPLAFLLYVWPLLLGLWMGRRHIDRIRLSALVVIVALPFLFHLFNVFPNTHFSRYSLYWWPTLLIVALQPLARMEGAPGGAHDVSKHVLSAFLVNMFAVGSLEGISRVRAGVGWNEHMPASVAAASPANVRRNSDALCAAVGCSSTPVGVAVVEVQIRRHLDGRFVVRSLDGVVDNDLAAHITATGINHLAYLEEKDVRVVLEFPRFSGDEHSDSLSQVRDEARARGFAIRGCSRFHLVPIKNWLTREILIRSRVEGCDNRGVAAVQVTSKI